VEGDNSFEKKKNRPRRKKSVGSKSWHELGKVSGKERIEGG